jgi:CxxC motif-containing protein (DUF1111 family)
MKTRARAIRCGLPRDITAQAVALLFASSAAMLAGAQTPTATQPGDPAFIGRAPFTDRLNPPAYEPMSPLPREQFDLGKAVFNTTWAPAGRSGAAASDGLGPLFVTNSCESCHNNGERGRAEPAPDKLSNSFVMQLGGPATVYNHVVNNQAIDGHRPEGRIEISWRERAGRHADGSAWTLREPVYAVTQLQYGPLPPGTVLRPRIAPAVFGNGLLESVSQKTLQAVRDAQPAAVRGDLLARLGWQAEVANIADQSAHAFAREMGVTSLWEAQDDCTAEQSECRAAPDGGELEVSGEHFAAVVAYQTRLAVPARPARDAALDQKGAELFVATGCAACHQPHLPVSRLSGPARIDAYTDLLRHDMGEELADRTIEGQPVSSLWRTAPLWGLAHVLQDRQVALLHDGRARTVEEAILWHGGQAQFSRRAFSALKRSQREQLLAWIATL